MTVQIIRISSGLSCGMNVASTTVVSNSVATSSESLPNDGEKPNQQTKVFVSKM